ncbi:hypothetical protein ACFLYR_04270 [Chloroflexota bacterium]
MVGVVGDVAGGVGVGVDGAGVEGVGMDSGTQDTRHVDITKANARNMRIATRLVFLNMYTVTPALDIKLYLN